MKKVTKFVVSLNLLNKFLPSTSKETVLNGTKVFSNHPLPDEELSIEATNLT